jgi:hypothetical protein
VESTSAEAHLVMLALWNGATALASEMQQLPSSGAKLVAPRSRRRNSSVSGVRCAKANLK